TASEIDGEMGDLKYDSLNGKHALNYLRYDVPYDQEYLAELGFHFSEKEVKDLSSMDNYHNIPTLYDIGSTAGARQIKKEHFPKNFSLGQSMDYSIRRFTQNKEWNLDFEPVRQKPVSVEAVQIDEPF